MHTDKIRSTFQKYGYSGTQLINKNELNKILDRLIKGEGYDEDVANQLWQQASNGASSIQINDLCRTINEGINILQSKLQEIADELKRLERQKLQISRVSGSNRASLNKIENDIANLVQDRDEYEQDLRLVTIPFGIDVNTNVRQNSFRYQQQNSKVGESMISNQSRTTVQHEQLKWIFYFSLIFGLIEIIVIYGKDDFLNLMVVTALLSIYLLNHFDNIYIKTTLILLALSEVLDIVWLFMYAGQKWSPPQVGNNSSYQTGYLRFIVFFAFVVVGIKIPIGYFLYRIKNINDSKYVISTGFFKIILSANKSNPITRGLAGVINNS